MKHFIKLSNLRAVLLAGACVGFVSHAATANEFKPAIDDYFASSVQSWLSDPVIVDAIKAQNSAHSGLDTAAIDALDKQWRAEADSGSGPLIDKLLGTDLSKFLADKKSASDGAISEVFVMDNKGLNVGQSDITSDYMQGDEGKWQKTYGSGSNTTFVDEVEFDESSQSFQSQLSSTIVDPASGEPIGAITIGLNVESLL